VGAEFFADGINWVTSAVRAGPSESSSTSYVSAAAFEAGLMEHGGMSPEDLARNFAEVHAFYERLPAERFPVLASIAQDVAPESPTGDRHLDLNRAGVPVDDPHRAETVENLHHLLAGSQHQRGEGRDPPLARPRVDHLEQRRSSSSLSER
jgi:hypothetical protein